MPHRRQKKKKKKAEGVDESWLLPYSDMLTLLLALFIVLFAMSEVDVQKFQRLASIFETEFSSGADMLDDGSGILPESAPGKEADEESDQAEDETDAREEYHQLKTMQGEMDAYIASNDLQDTLGTELTAEGLFITIRTDITFDSGSSKVKDEGKQIAKEIATLLNTDPPHEVVVNGHADDRPVNNSEYESNWELSTMRSIQFMYLLLDDVAIDPKWFSARGYGEYRPIVENTDKHNRALNRRVEVLVLPNDDIEEEVNTRAKKEEEDPDDK